MVSVLVLSFVIVAVRCTPGQFGGFYTADEGGCEPNPWAQMTCACPEDTVAHVIPYASYDVGPAYFHWCGATEPSASFGGAFMTREATCEVRNPYTASCSCPTGSVPLVTPSSSANQGANITIVLCMIQNTANFFGWFAEQNFDSQACIAANPYTGACSCNAAISTQNNIAFFPLRDQDKNGFVNIAVCAPKCSVGNASAATCAATAPYCKYCANKAGTERICVENQDGGTTCCANTGDTTVLVCESARGTCVQGKYSQPMCVCAHPCCDTRQQSSCTCCAAGSTCCTTQIFKICCPPGTSCCSDYMGTAICCLPGQECFGDNCAYSSLNVTIAGRRVKTQN